MRKCYKWGLGVSSDLYRKMKDMHARTHSWLNWGPPVSTFIIIIMREKKKKRRWRWPSAAGAQIAHARAQGGWGQGRPLPAHRSRLVARGRAGPCRAKKWDPHVSGRVHSAWRDGVGRGLSRCRVARVRTPTWRFATCHHITLSVVLLPAFNYWPFVFLSPLKRKRCRTSY